MKKTFLTMTALSALVLISPAFQDIAAAGQKKPIIRIARPQIVVKVQTDRLVSKVSKDVSEGAPSKTNRNRRTEVAIVTPPARRPIPRPDIFGGDLDQTDGIKTEDLGDINPDDIRVGTNPHDPDGLLAGLPWAEQDENSEFGNADTPDGPVGGTPNEFGDNGNESGTGPELDNPVGENSHSRPAPSAPGFLSRKGFDVSAVNPAGDKPPKPETTEPAETDQQPATGARAQIIDVRSETSDLGGGTTTTYTTYYYANGTEHHILRYNFSDGSGERQTWYADQDGNLSRAQVRYYDPPINEMRNPDYVDGGGWVPPWMEKEPKTFAEVVNGIGPGGLPPAPEHAEQGSANNTQQPIISQHDLLATNDPDSQTGGTASHTPINSCGKCEY